MGSLRFVFRAIQMAVLLLVLANCGRAQTIGDVWTRSLTLYPIDATDFSNTITLQLANNTAGGLTWTYPGSNGSSGQMLITDGSGNWSYSTPLDGSTFLLLSNATTGRNIMQPANSSSVSVSLKAFGSGSAHLLDLQNSSGTVGTNFNHNGALFVKPFADNLAVTVESFPSQTADLLHLDFDNGSSVSNKFAVDVSGNVTAKGDIEGNTIVSDANSGFKIWSTGGVASSITLENGASSRINAYHLPDNDGTVALVGSGGGLLSAGSGITIGNSGSVTTISATGGGTVTSVSGSGGTTGLTLTGGPITTSGTLTLGGTLAVADGGTGQTSYTDGQLLIGNTTGSTLTKSTLTAGSGITITNGSGGITIAATGGGGGMTNPMSTLGDMIIGDVAGAPARLPIGNTWDMLSVSAGIPAWVSATDVPTTSVSYLGAGGTFNDQNFGSVGLLLDLAPTTADANLTGIVEPVNHSVHYNIRFTAINRGTKNVTFKNQDAGSTAANRFSIGSDLLVAPGEIATLQYSTSDTRWVLVSTTARSYVGSGTVTSFSSGNLSPLFTTSVATAMNTPALSFSLTNQTAGQFFAGPVTGSPAAPNFRYIDPLDLPSLTGYYISNTTSPQSSASFNVTNNVATTAQIATTYTTNTATALTLTANTSNASHPNQGLSFNVANAGGSGGTAVDVVGTSASWKVTAAGDATLNSLALTSPLTAANGGTGQTTLTAHDVVVGNGTGNVSLISPSTTGKALMSNGVGADPSFQTLPVVVTSLSMYGDGSDGAVDFNGGAVTGATLAATTYTLTRSIYATTLHVGSFTVKTNGFALFATSAMTVDAAGVIHNDGNNATVGLSGGGAAGNATGMFPGGKVGANGPSTVSNGVNGNGVTFAYGGASGKGGGDGAGHTGGAAGASTAPAASAGSIRAFPMMYYGSGFNSSGLVWWQAGAGGGSGGNNGAGTTIAGNGGGGGSTVGIYALTVVNNGAIHATGGNGSTSAQANTGGGGGGGGGLIVIVTSSFSGNTPTVAGGTHGNGTGTGANGDDGASGNYFLIQNQ